MLGTVWGTIEDRVFITKGPSIVKGIDYRGWSLDFELIVRLEGRNVKTVIIETPIGINYLSKFKDWQEHARFENHRLYLAKKYFKKFMPVTE